MAFEFEVKEKIGEISCSDRGWAKEVNLVAWNNGEPRYDIRTWSPNHERPGKGITLSREETEKLYEILGDIMKEQKEQ